MCSQIYDGRGYMGLLVFSSAKNPVRRHCTYGIIPLAPVFILSFPVLCFSKIFPTSFSHEGHFKCFKFYS